MTAYAGVWGTLLGAFLLSVVTSLAMMAPPGRRNRYLDPGLAEAVAAPAAIAALVLGVVVVLLPLPTRRQFAAATETLAITVLVLLAAIAVYRGVVGANDGRDLDPGAVSQWLLAAVGILVLLTVLAVRADRARRREAAAHRPKRSRGRS